MGKRHEETQAELDGRNGVWSIPNWVKQFGCSAPTYYGLRPQPRSVKIGRRMVRIIESPRDYAERVRADQEPAV